MGENAEGDMVTEAIENGVKLLRRLEAYFSLLVGSADGPADIRAHSERLCDKVREVATHIAENNNCFAVSAHMSTVDSITGMFLTPVAMSIGKVGFTAQREHALREIQLATQRRVDYLRSDEMRTRATEYYRWMRDVELEIAGEDLAHGATRH
jgi:glutaredoxin-related protein